jgi:hypothetical protein
VSQLRAPLDYLEALVDGFSVDQSDLAGGLVTEVDNIKRRHGNLQHQINELLGDMEAASHLVSEFQGRIKSASSKLSGLDSELNKMNPVARDEASLAAQQHEIEVR